MLQRVGQGERKACARAAEVGTASQTPPVPRSPTVPCTVLPSVASILCFHCRGSCSVIVWGLGKRFSQRGLGD